ncbi:uncharacterized protein LOC115046138 isoform X2 [Echeneis naucrates]|uniref:uncharacterized protein LOC115046138 isoform X2 n=1 Tax=Echeneis naucrates TaxID=173247 RepID=UPI00111383AB|nr:uncharacterized protein LOC115046138 isoform X2 [Echeneis naucrates]
MDEKYPKSKLKRKKSSAVKLQRDDPFRDTVEEKRWRPALSSSDMTAETERSAVPAAAWWNRQQLPAVERLWAFTLLSALPCLEKHHCDLVPEFPDPSTKRPTALKSDEEQWCDLRREVAPFPEPSALFIPDLIRPSSSQQDLSAQTYPKHNTTAHSTANSAHEHKASYTADRQLPSHSRQSPDGQTVSLQGPIQRQTMFFDSCEDESSSAGCSAFRGEKSVQRGEHDEEAGPSNGPVHSKQLKFFNGLVCSKRKDGNEENVKVDGPRREERLQSCPMCLLVFPVGFTQMDCDGHLAQCLSEMNVDMTW